MLAGQHQADGIGYAGYRGTIRTKSIPGLLREPWGPSYKSAAVYLSILEIPKSQPGTHHD
jgi:hypothetical protein